MDITPTAVRYIQINLQPEFVSPNQMCIYLRNIIFVGSPIMCSCSFTLVNRFDATIKYVVLKLVLVE